MNSMKYLTLFVLILRIHYSKCAISDYVSNIKQYFGYEEQINYDTDLEFSQKIPYEVSAVDEKFIGEAAKLTGVALSELDSCQQRVVLKLKTDCHQMNDEQLAKLAVQLLNCQSYIEGRKMYPCSDDMSIRDCTSSMDSDTWTSYHLMSNRARAVCYTIRQNQFRGLAEHTVNKLMDSARVQLGSLNKIARNTEDLKDLSEKTYESLSKGNEELSQQQKDLKKAQFHGQLALEDNIKRLVDEKKLILEAHEQLVDMTKSIQNKLELSNKQIKDQTGESKLNHQRIIEDLIKISEKSQDIFRRIEESAALLMQHNLEFKNNYQSTIKNLAEVNQTVHNLVTLVGGTRQALEERLQWLSNALGGTDLAVERLYLILWHTLFVLLTMLTCAFLTARTSTRLMAITLPGVNLALALLEQKEIYMQPLHLAGAIMVLVVVQFMVLYAISYRKTIKGAISWHKSEPTTPKKEDLVTTSNKTDFEVNKDNFEYKSNFNPNFHDEYNDSLSDLTPPVSRNGFYSPRLVQSRSRSNTPMRLGNLNLSGNGSFKAICHAKTRVGTPCKLTAIPGRDFCHRHQSGDSVMG